MIQPNEGNGIISPEARGYLTDAVRGVRPHSSDFTEGFELGRKLVVGNNPHGGLLGTILDQLGNPNNPDVRESDMLVLGAVLGIFAELDTRSINPQTAQNTDQNSF